MTSSDDLRNFDRDAGNGISVINTSRDGEDRRKVHDGENKDKGALHLDCLAEDRGEFKCRRDVGVGLSWTLITACARNFLSANGGSWCKMMMRTLGADCGLRKLLICGV